MNVISEYQNTREGRQVTLKNMMKFLMPSLCGIIIFLVPITDADGNFNILLGVITEYFIALFEGFLPEVITGVIIISTVLSVITYFFEPKFITSSEMLNSLFNTSLLWTVIRVIAMIAIIMT